MAKPMVSFNSLDYLEINVAAQGMPAVGGLLASWIKAELSLAWDTEPGLSHCAVSQVTGRVVPLELCGEEASICLAPPAVSLES